MKRQEKHRSETIGWLRAGVLGANDGLISTSSLIVGVAAAHATRDSIVLTGCAGLVAGALPPLAIAWLLPPAAVSLVIATATLALLAALGALAARLGGAPLVRDSLRVTFWGACAMAATALVGRLFGAVL